MSGKEMRPLSLSIGASLLPSFSLVTASQDGGMHKDCHGKICNPVEEYCSVFSEACDSCATICDAKSHNYQADTCAKECSGKSYNRYEPLKAEIHNIQSNQQLILILLSILLILIAIRYAYKGLRWLLRKRCVQQMLQRYQTKSYPHAGTANGKDLNATTIQNLSAIRHGSDIERAPSQIYSVAGKCAAEGSVLTLTTPVSTRYPAENSTTPTTVVTEIGYGYDNQAMVVTPVSEKPTTATTGAF
ncbi:protein grindelwald isoform X1 [Drosophila subobscura]|uniref:protein grindelwald isoform X1 n=1 Tax=Drosophila subobscura TaxID=7241 RepID=UPI00155AF22E|nr:protein grindelwald isoform X1 [Drosophila subobscura]